MESDTGPGARSGPAEAGQGAAVADFRLPGGLQVAALVIGVPLLAVVLTGLVVATRTGAHAEPQGRATASAQLVFEDRPDGAVVVTRAPDHAPVAVLAAGSNAFVRVTLAGLVRERRREHQDARSRPFTVTRWSDGRLTLDDTATHRLIELTSFGSDNEASFARLLEAANRGGKAASGP